MIHVYVSKHYHKISRLAFVRLDKLWFLFSPK